jgi:cytochrome c-type biogenesis protein CcmE
MSRKRRRLIMLLVCGVCLGSAAALALFAFRANMVFFLAPADIAQAPSGRSFRLGGLVEAGSLQQSEQNGHPASRFRVTDGKASVPVVYVGILPDLFREGQGVVALGQLHNGVFTASEVLAKHDETYMPKEVEEALKKSGHWNPSAGPPPPAASWDAMRVVQKKAGG